MAAYLKFFALDEAPFEPSVSERFYYVGRAQHEAMQGLSGALSSAGAICVLSGPSGSGKTALVRMLMRRLPERMRLITIDDPRLSAQMLLATILRASGVLATSLESVAELTYKLRVLLEEQSKHKQLSTVIIDEAQGLDDEVLEQLRLISNLEGQYGRMINFLLVGQEDLTARLNTSRHRMLAGRIRLQISLQRFNREETAAYLSFRLQQAGCHDPVFTDKAVLKLCRLCGGLPRLINASADLCLKLAAARERRQVSAALVKKAFFSAQAGLRARRRPLLHCWRALRRCVTPVNIVSTATAALAACALCAGLLFLLRPYLPLHSFDYALRSEPAIAAQIEQALPALLPGRTEQSRLQAHFVSAVSSALFYSDALTTLSALEGVQTAEGTALSCATLPSYALGCAVKDRSLAELAELNYPALLRLYDDNLTPFYAILLHLSADSADLIVGDLIFKVRADYLRREDFYPSTVLFVQPPEADARELVGFSFAAGEGELLELLRKLSPQGRAFLRERLTRACERGSWGMCDFSQVYNLSSGLFNYAAHAGLTRFDADLYLRLAKDAGMDRPYHLRPQAESVSSAIAGHSPKVAKGD